MTFVFDVKSPVICLLAAQPGDTMGFTTDAQNARFVVTVLRPESQDWRVVKTQVIHETLATRAPAINALVRDGVLYSVTDGEWCGYMDGVSGVPLGTTSGRVPLAPARRAPTMVSGRRW